MDAEWPEPVVRVQALADAGADTIPDRYIKPPSERPNLSSRPSSLNIPIIDVARLNDLAMRDISEACREWGFFQLVNHGVSLGVLSRVRHSWKQFFASPMDVKQRYANSPKTYEGYGSRLGVEKGASLDWGDYYFLNLIPTGERDYNKWPETCREAVEDCWGEISELCGLLMKVLSLNLGLHVGHLQEEFGGDEFGAGLRVNYYPRCSQPELTLGLSSHSDPGGLTILLPDERVPGLQVRKGNSWVTVQPAPGAIIVNVGDQIQVLSNGIYKSVEHRVVVNTAEERLSLAFFYNPKCDMPLGPLPELLSPERPALYQPMTFNEYRMYIRKKGPRGKAQLNSLETT